MQKTNIAFLDAHEYSYHLMTEEDIDAAAEIVSLAFATNEPLTVHLKITQSSVFDLCKLFISETKKDNLSVVCKNKKGEVVAAVLNRDLATVVDFSYIDPSLKPIFTLLDKLVSKHFPTDSLSTVGYKQGAEIFMIGTKQNIIRQSIGRNLIRFSTMLFKQLGYQFSITAATSPIMQSIGVQSGFEPIALFDYADFQFQGENIFQATSFTQYKTSKKLFTEGKAGAVLFIEQY